MKPTAIRRLATCLIGVAFASPCLGQEQKFTQAEIDAAWAKHRSERRAYLDRSQQEAKKAIETVFKAWPKDPPLIAQRAVGVTAAFNDNGKWCQSPWSMASTDVAADPPQVAVCPIALDTYTELLVAVNLAMAHFLPDGFARLPTSQEMAAASSASEVSLNAILSYYTKRLVELYTSNGLIIRAPQHCGPEDVAYQAVHGRPLDECISLPKAVALKWLSLKKIDQDKLNNLSSALNEAIYLAVIAHELGHVAMIGNEAATAVDEEIQADRFAQRVLRGDPETFYLAGEALEELNVLWVAFANRDIKTRYRLPPHEDARATAYALGWRCVKRTDVKDPVLASMIEGFRLLKMEKMPPHFCEQKAK